MSGTLSGHQSVDSTIENSLFEFSNASIGADQLRDTQSNNAWGGAMQGLVSAKEYKGVRNLIWSSES